jgi:hypothetical protein
MKRLFFVCLGVLAIASGWASQRSLAQDPSSILQHYRVVPRQSILHQTGGIAGRDLSYRLLGKYDFFAGVATNTGPSFENAEIWGSPIGSPLAAAYVIDVDRILNLEGLKGEQLPVLSPFDVYRFRGLTSDGSSIELFASVFGPWMYVRGGTQPPPSSADYFKYQLQMTARNGPFADFNGDGVVDSADYALLRKGAANTDGLTAGASLADWRQQFGETVPDMAALDAMLSAAVESSMTTGSIPEPACITLISCGALLLVCLRRRRA